MHKKKRPYRVPVIRIDPETGEKVRFDSLAAGAKSVGVNPSQIHYAWLFGYRCRGYLWEKEMA